jgi:hypothetical protein
VAQLPLVMTTQGLQPQAPADLRAQLIALVAATNPDYTANLPGSLIEDISSTDVYACVESDSFLVDLVNSVTPYGANAFILSQLGALLGVDPQPVTNTSVNVVFSGPPGYVIAQGFTVSDGAYQYICQDGAICGADGNTVPVYAIATVPGAWPVPINTVSQLITSIPEAVGALAVTNPVDGVPSTSGETIATYRERVWTANLAASTGMTRYMKTLLGKIPGVEYRLISVQPAAAGATQNLIVVVGGGDPYMVAYAIWQAAFDISALTGAQIQIDYITNSNPCYIYTVNNHNLVNGDVETLTGIVGIPPLNNHAYPITVVGNKIFSVPVDSTQWGAYQYGGIVSPNPINELVTVTDYPDTYTIPFTSPPQELVSIILTWITNSPNFVSPDAIAQAGQPVIIDYINSLPVGETPINLNVMTKLFLDAIDPILSAELVIDVQYTVTISGVASTPSPGTQVIFGDPYSYFYTDSTKVFITEQV